MKKLAIKGHSTRYREVIEVLKMLGGKDSGYTGQCYTYYYYINDRSSSIEGTTKINKDNEYKIFTLEEFLEKYPYKVGDKVVYTKYGDNCDDYPVTIESMEWTGTTIEYTFDDCVTCLAKDLKMWNGEPDTVISGIYLNSCDYADEVELNLGDYEIVVRDGKTYAVRKKPKYPKTYEECCDVIECCVYTDFKVPIIFPYDAKIIPLLENIRKLLICRDTYWDIAGEQMGLGKPWEPDWTSSKPFYCIYVSGNIVGKGRWYVDNKILAFPTAEMQDAFYENFKDLIEQCKELL